MTFQLQCLVGITLVSLTAKAIWVGGDGSIHALMFTL